MESAHYRRFTMKSAPTTRIRKARPARSIIPAEHPADDVRQPVEDNKDARAGDAALRTVEKDRPAVAFQLGQEFHQPPGGEVWPAITIADKGTDSPRQHRRQFAVSVVANKARVFRHDLHRVTDRPPPGAAGIDIDLVASGVAGEEIVEVGGRAEFFHQRRRGHQQFSGIAEVVHDYPRLRFAADAQADVDLVFHVVQAGSVHPPIRLQIRVFGTAREERGDDGVVFRQKRQGDAHRAAHFIRRGAGTRGGEKPLALGEELLRFGQKTRAEIGELHVAGVAHEQRLAKVVFQLGDDARHHLRRHGQTLRRLAELQSIGSGAEIFEGVEFVHYYANYFVSIKPKSFCLISSSSISEGKMEFR